jgi:hypothetical protein
MKIGIIQVQRLGDIIIALPIAAWFIRQGHEVYWPVLDIHYPSFQAAGPAVNFLPISAGETANQGALLYDLPLVRLQALGCELILPLYTTFGKGAFCDETLKKALKFDEYKYAYAGVPFSEKWTLSLVRNHDREKELYDGLGITRPYICVHSRGYDKAIRVILPDVWQENFQIVEIEPLTDNLFDWLYIIEHAAKRVMIDSVFANLTEQLNMAGENYLFNRSIVEFTPVYRNGWFYCWQDDPVPDLSLEYQAAQLSVRPA